MNGPDGLYRSVVATTPDAILTMDEGGLVLSANPAAERMFGYAESELVGKPSTVIMPERFREQHAAGLARYLKTGERKLDWSYLRLPGMHRDGHEISLSISFGEYVENDRKVFTGILRDISDVMQREAGMRFLLEASEALTTSLDYEATLRKVAELATRSIADWAAVDLVEHGRIRRVAVVHPDPGKLRIARDLETGVRGPLGAEQLADVQSIQRSQAHLLAIINDMLNFAKLEAGKVQFTYVEIRLEPLLRGLEELVRPQLLEKDLAYTYRSFDGTSTAFLDGEKFQQVMLNPLSNAIKYTDRGGRIDVYWKIDDGDVVVNVRDTGKGIPPDKLEAIFEPFVQVEPLRTRVTGGAGLGLAISQDIARRMGGGISVESTMGKGSTFTLRLPSAQIQPATPPQ